MLLRRRGLRGGEGARRGRRGTRRLVLSYVHNSGLKQGPQELFLLVDD
jgi:hypothetical protein